MAGFTGEKMLEMKKALESDCILPDRLWKTKTDILRLFPNPEKAPGFRFFCQGHRNYFIEISDRLRCADYMKQKKRIAIIWQRLGRRIDLGKDK